VHVCASHTRKSALQRRKAGTVEEIITVKLSQSTSKSRIAHLLAQHVKQHQRLAIADGGSRSTMAGTKDRERYVAVGGDIVGILLQDMLLRLQDHAQGMLDDRLG